MAAQKGNEYWEGAAPCAPFPLALCWSRESYLQAQVLVQLDLWEVTGVFARFWFLQPVFWAKSPCFLALCIEGLGEEVQKTRIWTKHFNS